MLTSCVSDALRPPLWASDRARGPPSVSHEAAHTFTLTRRQALAAALALSEYLSPMRVEALDAAEQEQKLLVQHAARFALSPARPASVANIFYEGKPMRQLVATVNLRANTRVAAYPVEVVSDFDDHGEEYALGIWREYSQRGTDGVRRRFRQEFENVSGVPTRKSLRRAYVNGLPTIAMFANEPDATHLPNCELAFPTTTAAQLRLGDVYYAYLETTRPVSVGEPLTICYGFDYFPRSYPTACDPRLRAKLDGR